MTGSELGKGEWATVSVATFKDTQVAAKSLNVQTIAAHNIELYLDQMQTIAKIRHPNCVQFIGATLGGEIIILTELMPTSLRSELSKEYLPPSRVTSIGLDVARALKYLHSVKPCHIIHRNISSGNVLLEPLPNGHWRGKVSDSGTVDLLEKLEISVPSNPIYAAPEASDPSKHSPKMDIFSFGVLLVEMLTGEAPAIDNRERLLHITHPQLLVSLIQRCLNENAEDRPNSSEIISEIDH